MEWLHTPIAVVRSSLKMLPRLQAEEACASLDQLLLAGGRGVSDRDFKSAKRILDRAGDRRRRRAPAVSGPAGLAALGIGYTVKEKP